VECEAVLWDGTVEAATPIINWILECDGTARYHEETREGIAPFRPDDINVIVTPAFLAIDTLEGTMKASPGDYVVRGIVGEFYPVKPSIFEASYEPL